MTFIRAALAALPVLAVACTATNDDTGGASSDLGSASFGAPCGPISSTADGAYLVYATCSGAVVRQDVTTGAVATMIYVGGAAEITHSGTTNGWVWATSKNNEGKQYLLFHKLSDGGATRPFVLNPSTIYVFDESVTIANDGTFALLTTVGNPYHLLAGNVNTPGFRLDAALDDCCGPVSAGHALRATPDGGDIVLLDMPAYRGIDRIRHLDRTATTIALGAPVRPSFSVDTQHWVEHDVADSFDGTSFVALSRDPLQSGLVTVDVRTGLTTELAGGFRDFPPPQVVAAPRTSLARDLWFVAQTSARESVVDHVKRMPGPTDRVDTLVANRGEIEARLSTDGSTILYVATDHDPYRSELGVVASDGRTPARVRISKDDDKLIRLEPAGTANSVLAHVLGNATGAKTALLLDDVTAEPRITIVDDGWTDFAVSANGAALFATRRCTGSPADYRRSEIWTMWPNAGAITGCEDATDVPFGTIPNAGAVYRTRPVFRILRP